MIEYWSQHKGLIKRLAETYGTPLYAYDAGTIKKKIDSILSKAHPSVKLFYSMKANPNTSIVYYISQQKVGLEISSLLELEVAKIVGVSPDDIIFLGPGKTALEIDAIIEYGVRFFILESAQELELVFNEAKKRQININIMLRINPSSSANGPMLKMGGESRQFGIDQDQIESVIRRIKEMKYISIIGIHMYHGTRILSAEVSIANIKDVLTLAAKYMQEYGLRFTHVGLGGGMGIPYFDGEAHLDLDKLQTESYKVINSFAKRFPNITLLLESGRYIVGESGVYISRVLYTKTSQGRDFVVMDGGSHQLNATSGNTNIMKRNFPVFTITNKDEEYTTQTITGCLCTPNDLLAREIELPRLKPNDLIGVANIGAYGLTASPVLFLSNALPREVLINNGVGYLIRDNEEFQLTKLRKIK